MIASVCAVAPIAFAFGQAAKDGKVSAGAPQPREVRQNGMRRGMSMGGGMMLLINEKVQKDLGLSAAQIKTLTAKAGKIFPGIGGGKPGERPPMNNPTDMQKQFSEMEALVKKTLSAAQQSRLKQIMLQQRGFRAWSDPEVAKKLGLTTAQKEKIQKLQEANRGAMRNMFQSAQSKGDSKNATPPRADFSKIDAMRKKEETQMMGILTAAQKTTWSAMIGKKIDLSGGFRMGSSRGGPGGPPPTGKKGGR